MLVQDVMFLVTCAEPERLKGSSRFLLSLLTTSLLAQLLFSLTTFLLSLLPPFSFLLFYPCYGLWPVIITEISVRCWSHPDLTINPCGLPIPIKAKFYPLLLVLIFSLLFWEAIFEFGFGLIIAYFCMFLYRLVHEIREIYTFFRFNDK